MCQIVFSRSRRAATFSQSMLFFILFLVCPSNSDKLQYRRGQEGGARPEREAEDRRHRAHRGALPAEGQVYRRGTCMVSHRRFASSPRQGVKCCIHCAAMWSGCPANPTNKPLIHTHGSGFATNPTSKPFTQTKRSGLAINPTNKPLTHTHCSGFATNPTDNQYAHDHHHRERHQHSTSATLHFNNNATNTHTNQQDTRSQTTNNTPIFTFTRHPTKHLGSSVRVGCTFKATKCRMGLPSLPEQSTHGGQRGFQRATISLQREQVACLTLLSSYAHALRWYCRALKSRLSLMAKSA